jgi:hypothetical protein
MFGWIRRMFDAAYGAIDDTVRNWVHDLVNGLYGFLHLIFGDVRGAWDTFASRTDDLWHSAEKFARIIATSFAILYRVLLPRIIARAEQLFGEAVKYAKGIYDFAVREIDRLGRLIVTTADHLWHDVITDVWDPLFKSVTTALKWIGREGALVLYYITHPDKLVELIWNAILSRLEATAWDTGALLGKFFLSLVVRNLKRFALLLEDILDAIL